jgi:hypothetical protein
MGNTTVKSRSEIRDVVAQGIQDTKIIDVHTHLFPPSFGELCLYGIDELLTYHYLISEAFLWLDIPYESFWKMSKREQADLIWETLFLQNSPVSEAAQGILTILDELNVPVSKNLDDVRRAFDQRDVDEYISRVMHVSNVEEIVMTNDPFDPAERQYWEKGEMGDDRFRSALRLDPLVNDWDHTVALVREMGYEVDERVDRRTVKSLQQFLKDWIEKIHPLYVALSLPHTFTFPERGSSTRILEECLIPICEQYELPMALMVGTKRQVNPDLKLAGDMAGRADMAALENLCRQYPHQKFLVTMLSRENQYELITLSRKFRNLMIFGCWWFLNTPYLVEEITRMRFQLLGNRFIPQHSDCRVFEQLIYKWKHTKHILENLLMEHYEQLLKKGWPVEVSDIRNDIEKLLRGNVLHFINS